MKVKRTVPLITCVLLSGCQVGSDSATKTGSSALSRSGATVVFWNLVGTDATLSAPLGALAPLRAPLGSRALAMMHVAIADSVTGDPFLVDVDRGGTDKIAAAASAAHGVLVRLYPTLQPTFDTALAQSLAQVPDGRRKIRGVALGDQVAAQVVALRANDGADHAIIPYNPTPGLGVWAPESRTGDTPFQSWRYVTPWAMTSPDQFRAGPPPDIYGAQFAADLAELFPLGRATGSTRTAEQTCIARFVTDNPVAQYNRLARLVANRVPKNIGFSARMFATVNIALADAFISAFDGKFTYGYWRPWQAIRAADQIGHPELLDATWVSLIPTPAHPEYPANHAYQSAAVTTVLKAFYGPDIPPVELSCSGAGCDSGGGGDPCTIHNSTTFPGFTVTSGHLDDFKSVFGLARIYGGIHYRNSINVGWSIGQQVAQNALATAYTQDDGDEGGDGDGDQ